MEKYQPHLNNICIALIRDQLFNPYAGIIRDIAYVLTHGFDKYCMLRKRTVYKLQ